LGISVEGLSPFHRVILIHVILRSCGASTSSSSLIRGSYR